MVPRETGNNAYAKFWRGQTKSIMVFLILANIFQTEVTAVKVTHIVFCFPDGDF